MYIICINLQQHKFGVLEHQNDLFWLTIFNTLPTSREAKKTLDSQSQRTAAKDWLRLTCCATAILNVIVFNMCSTSQPAIYVSFEKNTQAKNEVSKTWINNHHEVELAIKNCVKLTSRLPKSHLLWNLSDKAKTGSAFFVKLLGSLWSCLAARKAIRNRRPPADWLNRSSPASDF